MNKELAKEIFIWRYKKPYDYYNVELTEENMREFLDVSYFSVITNYRDLVGFFCIGKNEQIPEGQISILSS